MNSVRQESFNLVNGGRIQNLVPLTKKLEYLSRYKPFAAFSDFLWMISHNYLAEEVLYEQFDAALDEVSLELFCDQKTCDLFLSHMSDVMEEASAWDSQLKFSEISYRKDENDTSTNYVITISGDWTVSIEAYTGNWLPTPSAFLVAYGTAGEYVYFADSTLQDAIEKFEGTE